MSPPSAASGAEQTSVQPLLTLRSTSDKGSNIARPSNVSACTAPQQPRHNPNTWGAGEAESDRKGHWGAGRPNRSCERDAEVFVKVRAEILHRLPLIDLDLLV